MAVLSCALILPIGICNLFVTKYDLKLNTKLFIFAAINEYLVLTSKTNWIMKLNLLRFAIVAILLAVVNTASCSSQNSNQFPTKLPATAQAIVDKHFAGKSVVLVTQEMEFVRRYYVVVFSDGTKIKFDSRGIWDEIDCHRSPVPEALIPRPILDFVKKHYPGVFVTEIDRETRGYDVELSNGIDIEFNKNFQVREIDT